MSYREDGTWVTDASAPGRHYGLRWLSVDGSGVVVRSGEVFDRPGADVAARRLSWALKGWPVEVENLEEPAYVVASATTPDDRARY